jgi:hypothetical protein
MAGVPPPSIRAHDVPRPRNGLKPAVAIQVKGLQAVKFTSAEEFELHVHKCFGKIFDGLLKVDAVVKERAEEEEDSGNYGTMCDLRDTVEEVILHCHLAWQYHRLSKVASGRVASTWDKVEDARQRDVESGSTREEPLRGELPRD